MRKIDRRQQRRNFTVTQCQPLVLKKVKEGIPFWDRFMAAQGPIAPDKPHEIVKMDAIARLQEAKAAKAEAEKNQRKRKWRQISPAPVQPDITQVAALKSGRVR